jgi:hypothetical protein
MTVRPKRPEDSSAAWFILMPFQPITINVSDRAREPFERRREPVRVGVDCARGFASTDRGWVLRNHRNEVVPVQATALDKWDDGTVRCLLVDFQADVMPGATGSYTLTPGDSTSPSNDSLVVTRDAAAIVVSNGPARFEIPLTGSGFLRAWVGGRSLVQSSAIVATDVHGVRREFAVRRAAVVHNGSLRSTVRMEGDFLDPRGQLWLLGFIQLHFYAGHGGVSGEFTVTNPRAASHPGGTWDLGDAGSAFVRELAIEVRLEPGESRSTRSSLDSEDRMQAGDESFSIYQDSSGGENWQHSNHVNRDGRVPTRFRGFEAIRNRQPVHGWRATPIASIGSGDATFTVAMPRFWQVFPKALAIDPQHCVIGMLPPQYGDRHELQGGERSTLRFAMCFGEDTVCAEPLAWVREPAVVWPDPQTSSNGGFRSPWAGSAGTSEQYRALVDAAVTGPQTFEQRREIIDEYGWRNFGDLFADHEAVHRPLVSHYNNQYDALAGFIHRFRETGDARWWTLADDLALHVADVDLYHTDGDRAAYSGGHFWHTQHYQPAGTATHRAYSKRNGSSGGGPSAEHNYTSGLMQHYFLTGDHRSRDAVVQLADWVLNMDDGSKSPFRWIDRDDTGLASGTRDRDFHGPGRGAGNSINALLDAHRLTGDSRYLEKAEALVCRCVHPDDEVDGLNLLDIENRWSYTVFLQVIGKYLEYRAERRLNDHAFQYARAVLLRYAAWMALHERPYLETPEKLEFPTETWAAQDLRKAAVFEFAAKFTADPDQRALFAARATAFFDTSIAYLAASPTGHLTRPIVLLLAYAVQRPQPGLDIPAATSADRWPVKPRFVAHRTRVIRRVGWAVAALSATLLIIASVLWS